MWKVNDLLNCRSIFPHLSGLVMSALWIFQRTCLTVHLVVINKFNEIHCRSFNVTATFVTTFWWKHFSFLQLWFRINHVHDTVHYTKENHNYLQEIHIYVLSQVLLGESNEGYYLSGFWRYTFRSKQPNYIMAYLTALLKSAKNLCTSYHYLTDDFDVSIYVEYNFVEAELSCKQL